MDRKQTIEALRQQIAGLQPAPRVHVGRLPGGHPSLDAALGGGWPRPGLSEITGRPGSGRLAAVRPGVAALTQAGRPVALIDPLGRLYPPGWVGVVLSRLIVVQPAPEQTGWAAEQLARSGAVPLVILLDPPRLGQAGARLIRAAEQGDCALIVLGERPDVRLPAGLRLESFGHSQGEVSLRITRARGGLAGRQVRLPAHQRDIPSPA